MARRTKVFVMLMLAGKVAAVESLHDPAGWIPKVFVEESAGIAESDAAVFTRTVEGRGHLVLSVGPWVAGEWSARFEAKAKLPFTRVTVRGRYRTESLAPLAAEIRVTYWQGDQKLGTASMHLGSATGWTEFVFPARHPRVGAESLTIGVGLAEKTAGRVQFSRILATEGAAPFGIPGPGVSHRQAAPALLQRPVSRAVQSTPAAPRWWLGESGGAWWLISPGGHPVYSSGVDAPAADGAGTLAWLAAHGFNSLGGWTNVWAWAKVMPDPAPVFGFHALESGGLSGDFDHLVNAKGETCGSDGHAFPDPFDPRFAAAYRASVRDVLAAVADKTWFAAWFADNELAHDDLPRFLYSAGAGKAFVKFLTEKYSTAERLNHAWTRSFTAFGDVLIQKPDPVVRRGALWDDCRLFAREIVKRYIEVTLTALREEDPGRLVFSNRFMLGDTGDTLDVIDLYARYDGIAVNCYPANLTSGLSEGERQVLQHIHEKTGKPILIGEWSIPAIDSGLYDPAKPLDWSWSEVVDTQTERAAQAARVAADFHDLPFVVGAHWFIWKDVDTSKRRANRGLFKADGQPWSELTDALGAVQKTFKAR